MKKLEYRKGLKVRQRCQPNFTGCNALPRREGVTVSDELVEHRASPRAEYAQVLWNGSKNPEFVHFVSIDIIQEEVANAG